MIFFLRENKKPGIAQVGEEGKSETGLITSI
jgi:hypothetical protein